MKPSLWEFACFKENVNELHLNQDYQVVLGVFKLEHQKDFSELNQTRIKGWDGQEVVPSLGGPLSRLLDPGLHLITASKGLPSGSAVKNPPAVQEPQEAWVPSLGREDPLQEGITPHSSILAWRIAWTEEPGGLQSMG